MRPSYSLPLQHGFTMVELIIVLLIAGILSTFAAVKLNDLGEVHAQGYADEVASVLRFAQKQAIDQRTLVYVNVAAASGRVYACYDATTPTCATELSLPSGDKADTSAPSNVTMTANVTQFSFNGLGSPSTATTVTLVLTAGTTGYTATVTVQPDTGYVQRS